MTKIKVCGITNFEDAKYAVNLGIDALGFVFVEGSKRKIEPQQAKDIISKLPAFVISVGVFADSPEDEVYNIAKECKLSCIQLHGSEPPQYLEKLAKEFRTIKAIRVRNKSDLQSLNNYPYASAYLLDTYSQETLGGSGEVWNWSIIDRELLKNYPIILAGGLNPENVSYAIRLLQPYAVDVSSGVERAAGKKDKVLLREFVRAVRLTDEQIQLTQRLNKIFGPQL